MNAGKAGPVPTICRSRPLQGLLYRYLADFAEREFGRAVWERARTRAGVAERSFVVWRQYPDRYAHDLVAAVIEELGDRAPPADEILFRFGRFVARCFERDYEPYFRRFASAREMIAGIEPVIHTELRRHDPASRPPQLRTAPARGGRLRLTYASPRRLCQLLLGLTTEVGEIYGEPVMIEEVRCMHRGDAACEMLLAFGRRSP